MQPAEPRSRRHPNGVKSQIVERVLSEIDRRQDEITATVADLVSLPSTLGSEAAAQHYVASHLRSSSTTVDVWESEETLKQLPGAGDPGVPFAGRPNVAGVLKGSDDGRSLILNGHIDVVSPEPVDAWSYPPWEPTVVGHRMFGRGAFDMKSGIAINLLLPRIFNEIGIGLGGDLIVQSVIEEESSGNGALDASRRYSADAALVTESMNGELVYAHVGVMWFKVTIEGKTSHAAKAPDGVSAISKAVPVIQSLEALDSEMNRSIHPDFSSIDHPVGVNVGVVHGGDWPSTLAGRCELQCRIGFYPGLTTTEIQGMIERAIGETVDGDDWLGQHPPVITYFGHRSEGSIVSLDEPIVRSLARWHREVWGESIRTRADTGTLDMRYFNRSGVPSGCYGATGANAHAADEWLDLTSLVPTAKTLAGVVMEWCGVRT